MIRSEELIVNSSLSSANKEDLSKPNYCFISVSGDAKKKKNLQN